LEPSKVYDLVVPPPTTPGLPQDTQEQDVLDFLTTQKIAHEAWREFNKKRKLEAAAQGGPLQKKGKITDFPPEQTQLPPPSLTLALIPPSSPGSDESDDVSEHFNDEIQVGDCTLFTIFDSCSFYNYLLLNHTNLPGFQWTDHGLDITEFGGKTVNVLGEGTLAFIYQGLSLSIETSVVDKITESNKGEFVYRVDLLIGKETMIELGIISRKPQLGLELAPSSATSTTTSVDVSPWNARPNKAYLLLINAPSIGLVSVLAR